MEPFCKVKTLHAENVRVNDIAKALVIIWYVNLMPMKLGDYYNMLKCLNSGNLSTNIWRKLSDVNSAADGEDSVS